MAAVDAGCDFFAGYPITPATSILHGMMNELPGRGGVVIQGEDEISSIGMCIGAVAAGRRAMTASSGPGMSLYSENIGLAIMGEMPLVIVNVQRQGPATGSATKGADGDVQFMRWGTSGGFPMIVLSPENVRDCYLLTFRAFRWAERFRCPVIVASQKEVGLTREVFDLEEARQSRGPEVVRRKAPADGAYLPHDFVHHADVGPLSPMGGSHVVRFTTSMHDKRGWLTKDPEEIQDMMEHLSRKVTDCAEEMVVVDEDLQEGAETLVVVYGVTARAARDAVDLARERGGLVSLLVVKCLYPVPEARLRRAMAETRRVVCPEMNQGQYVHEISRLARGRKVIPVNKMNTELISPGEILKRISADLFQVDEVSGTGPGSGSGGGARTGSGCDRDGL